MSLQQVWHELAPHWPAHSPSATTDALSLTIPAPNGATECRLVETLQRFFLMQIRTVELQLRVPLQVARGECLSVHYGGWLLRGPLMCRTSGASSAAARAAQRLCASQRVQQTMAQVDFTRFELCGEGNALCVRLALYGGSELRSRLPGLQRYVRLGTQQTCALFTALQVLCDALLGEVSDDTAS